MEEKIVICPYCGASVPKNWRFCPKCAHILTGEPVVTVLTPPPDDKAPDWTDNLLEAVEVSYLDESDLEPLPQEIGSSPTEPMKAPDSDRIPPVKEPDQSEVGPSTNEEADSLPQDEIEFETPPPRQEVSSGETDIQKDTKDEEGQPTDSGEPPLEEKPPLPQEQDDDPKNKNGLLAAFSHLKRYLGKRAVKRENEVQQPEQKIPPTEAEAVTSHRRREPAALFKKLLPLRPPSSLSSEKDTSPGVRLPSIVKKGLKWFKHRTKIVPPPVYLAVERKRNRRTALAVLCIVLLLGGGAPFALWRADIEALEASLELGWSRSEVHERTPYTLALRFEDGVVEIYQKSPFYRNEYVLSQKPYTVTSPETVVIEGKEYRISFSEDHKTITMYPAFSFYGEKEIWHRQETNLA